MTLPRRSPVHGPGITVLVGDTTVALVMLARGVEPAAARARLHAAVGHVRNALADG